MIEQTERFPRGSVVRVDVSAGYGSLFVAGGQVVVDARAVRLAVDGAQSARMLSLLRTGRGLDVKLRRVVLRVVVVVEVEAVRDVVVEQRLRRRTQSPYSSNSNSNSGGFRGVRGLHPPWRPSQKFRVCYLRFVLFLYTTAGFDSSQ